MVDFLNRKILWVKFKLPALKFGGIEDSPEEDDDFSSDWERKERENDPFSGMGSPGGFLGTPMGIISTLNQSDYEKSYNMWMAHTNFEITKQHIIALNKIEGIDGLQPVSRYRFNVIVGFNFDEAEIKSSVEKVLVGDLNSYLTTYQIVANNINPVLPPDVESQFQAAISLIGTPYYGILVLPNGKMVIVKSGALTETFIKDIHQLQQTQGATGGYLYVHDGKKKIL